MEHQEKLFSLIPLEHFVPEIKPLSSESKKDGYNLNYCDIESYEDYRVLLSNILRAKNDIGEFKTSSNDILDTSSVYTVLNSGLTSIMLNTPSQGYSIEDHPLTLLEQKINEGNWFTTDKVHTVEKSESKN